MDMLTTDRLILRRWKESDSTDMYDYAKTDLVGPSAGWRPHKNEDETKRIIKMFIRQNDSYAIVLKSENKVIGSIGLHSTAPNNKLNNLNQREIGYTLHPNYWGCGIVPEAVKHLINIAFTKLDLDIIWCYHFDDNHKSKRVIEKCGFKYQFTKNEVLTLLNNKEVTLLYYSITKDYYLNRLNSL